MQSLKKLLQHTIGFLQVGPPRRQWVGCSPLQEIDSHLDSIQDVAAAMAEIAESVPELVSLTVFPK
jgi:hypothetical protein